MRAKYQENSPLKPYVGFVITQADYERSGWTGADQTYFRVQARSGFEAQNAAARHFGEETIISVWNWDELNQKRTPPPTEEPGS